MEITFSDLKTKIDALLKQTSEEKIIPILQDIMHTLLSGYVFKIKGNKGVVTIDPIELEAYFFKDSCFEDDCVHRNEKQKNNFGRLYVHKTKNNHLKGGTRKGMDLCLSDSENYSLAFLIRSAYLDIRENNVEERLRICGPCLLTDEVFQKLKFDYKKEYDKLESQEVLIKEEKPETEFYLSSRINVNSNKKDEFLRMVRIEDNYFTGLKEIKKLKVFDKHKK
ncbi:MULTISPECIES: hypothetical protein [unclassified Treponema]|uniref:hypothetical protein n=1 Tax=unclassified Treponema TaxID=2638727 RepID=UPI0020A569F8|nr:MULTISPECIES: hypothetical protein [unclassified Treponema]UTC66766.1 hypothetical protein E4O06_12580 [Treponema sp. OMZ 789]UTC69499.1 hypothetical protein E4O01_12720 [Treponema sp. OMZ 790]UTC72213.1 hypothetical protein E4O02_12815 [Treponema sp. OMZ 791]